MFTDKQGGEMALITLTPELAIAAGHTAATVQRMKAGRSKWNRADYNLACETQARLMLECGTEMQKLAAREVLRRATAV